MRERKNRGKYIQKGIHQINTDHVRLSLRQHGIWDHDGECRIQMVLFTAGKPDGVHGGISVCACDAAFKRSIHTHHGTHCISDEQQAEFRNFLCESISQFFLLGQHPQTLSSRNKSCWLHDFTIVLAGR